MADVVHAVAVRVEPAMRATAVRNTTRREQLLQAAAHRKPSSVTVSLKSKTSQLALPSDSLPWPSQLLMWPPGMPRPMAKNALLGVLGSLSRTPALGSAAAAATVTLISR